MKPWYIALGYNCLYYYYTMASCIHGYEHENAWYEPLRQWPYLIVRLRLAFNQEWTMEINC